MSGNKKNQNGKVVSVVSDNEKQAERIAEWEKTGDTSKLTKEDKAKLEKALELHKALSAESVLVNQQDGTTEVLPVQPAQVENTDNVEAIILPVETKEPQGTTEEVKKIVVPSKVAANKLDEYDTQLINMILGSNLLETALQAVKDAPSVKESMIKEALQTQEIATSRYTELMAKGVIMPFTPEFEQLQGIMLQLHEAKQAEETARNTDVSTIAESSIKAMRDSLVKDIQALRLSVFGKETTNSGKPEGSPRNGKALDWQSETTISYWRNSSFLQICPVTWFSVEFREQHELQANWYVAIDGKTGAIVYKVPSATTYSNLFFQITAQQLVEKGEELPETDTWGKNQTLIGSTTTDKQKAEYAGLTQEALRELVGDKGNDFTVSISEEVGKDDETAAIPVVTQTEQPESVSA